ncbi:MAG: TIGR04282 family arsenosugar biosynthesis glycosyltransferase [Deltaproteobacteria bacterium]|nr:TIGR04282 family arsenosugar biosynthesis glycosyltransferase [Deltaproteobacteria bacterium]
MKTRLASAIGSVAAAELARAFLLDTWRTIERRAWARPILATTDFDSGLPAPPSSVWLQGDGDLGDRLERILVRALRDSAIAIAIGADSPGLPAPLLDDARAALSTHDAVVGPAVDGGFYLLGLRRCPPDLFANIPWSTPATCERTIAGLRRAGLRVAQIAPWFDVDTVEDLARLRRLLATHEVEAPETARVLSSKFRRP